MSEDGILSKLEKVSKTYGDAEEQTTQWVLRDISLSIEKGASLAVVGPSGCGKSTLLNLIGALDRPTEGKAYFENNDLASLEEERLATIRNKKIGFVFQEHHLLPQCTALENVLVPTLAGGRKNRNKTQANERATELLERVGLSERLHHRPSMLSGGERQRVAVVRAMINQPLLLLCDEPTGALDRESSDNLSDLLCQLNKQDGITLLIVTHALHLAERMNTIYELRDGRLQRKESAS